MSDKAIMKLYPDMEIIYCDNQRVIFSKNIKSKAVLLIHGSPGSSAQFLLTDIPRKIIDETNLAVIIIDRCGYGYSEYGKLELSIELSAKKIANCLELFTQIDNLTIVGYSYGGAIAAYVSTLTRVQINSLILISASAKPNAERTYWFNYLLSRIFFAKMIPHCWNYANSEKLTHSQCLNDIKDIWQKVKSKTICLHGDKDKLIYPENAAFIKDNVTSSSGTRVEIIAGARHNILWNYSDHILTLVRDSNLYASTEQ